MPDQNSRIYFISLSTLYHAPLFGSVDPENAVRLNPFGRRIEEAWMRLSETDGIDLDAFSVLPDAIQGILWISDGGEDMDTDEMPERLKGALEDFRCRTLQTYRTYYGKAPELLPHLWEASAEIERLRHLIELEAVREYILEDAKTEERGYAYENGY